MSIPTPTHLYPLTSDMNDTIGTANLTIGGSPIIVHSEDGMALNKQGSTSKYVSVPLGDIGMDSGKTWSISWWYKLDSGVGWSGIVYLGTRDYGPNYGLHITSTSTSQRYGFHSNDVDFQSGWTNIYNKVTNNNWVHFVYVYDKDNDLGDGTHRKKAYADGVELTNTSGSNVHNAWTGNNTSHRLDIGGWGANGAINGNQYWLNLAIFDTAISLSEAQAIYAKGENFSYSSASPSAFPGDVSLGIVSWYDGASFDTTNNKWVDKAGTLDLSSDYITGTISKKSQLFDSVLISNRNNKRYHQSKFPIYLSGNKNSGILFNKDASYQFLTDGSYTFFHVARRDPSDVNQTGRVFDASGVDWYSGFNDASSGVAKHENDSINTIDKGYGTNWVVSVDTPKYYRSVGYSDTSNGYYETSSGNRNDTNTTSPQVSVHYGSNTFQTPISTGGVVTNYSNYSINTFLSSGTLNITRNTTADFLIVGGGGGGGGQTHIGGGGGAGGVVIATNQSLAAGSYNVVVGSGGQGALIINPPAANGGITNTYTDNNIEYTSFTFLSNGTFNVTSEGYFDFIIVGAGGSGGSHWGGGGGGGGVIIGTSQMLTTGTYTITVGSGSGQTGQNAQGADGNDSSIVGNSINLVAKGGGGGGWDTTNLRNGRNGGSGGGGADESCIGGSSIKSDGTVFTGGSVSLGDNITLYGNVGGSQSAAAGVYWPQRGMGGGGAGGPGEGVTQNGSPNHNKGPSGGIGIENNFRTGSNVYYAGGGGGPAHSNYPQYVTAGGDGGLGGGGNGDWHATNNGTAGAVNTGGGGGGGSYQGTGESGGSGIVIIRHSNVEQNNYGLNGSDSTFNGFTAIGGGAGGTGNYVDAINSSDVSGGTESQYSIGNITYQVHSFTQTGNNTLTITKEIIADFMLVGGGGGGSGRHGGGGGGGGVVIGTNQILVPGTYTINIGSGGQGGDYTDASYTFGLDGSNTEFPGNIIKTFSNSDVIKAMGGGGGGLSEWSSTGTTGFSNIINNILQCNAGFNNLESLIELWIDGTNVDSTNNTSYSDGNTVTTWKDLSGKGNHLVQGWRGGTPTFSTNLGPSGSNKSVVNFTGDSLRYVSGTIEIKYIFLVHKIQDTGNKFLFDFRSGGSAYADGNAWLWKSGTGWDNVIVHENGVANSSASYSSSYIYSNQWAITVFNAGYMDCVLNFMGNSQYGEGDATCTGLIAEMIIFNASLTNDQINMVENYLAVKWNLTSIMDSDADTILDNVDTTPYGVVELQGNTGSSGGSGGGGRYNSIIGKSKYYDLNGTIRDLNGGSATISTNIIAYGNDGGVGQNNGYWPSGGGGGAGGAGGSPSTNQQSPGDGGIGIQNSFLTNSNNYYAGGGGASSKLTDTGGSSGGSGGGGDGKAVGGGNGGDALANTGGGGGGAGGDAYRGGHGGSGYAVVRFAYNDLSEKGDADIGGSGGGGGGNYLAGNLPSTAVTGGTITSYQSGGSYYQVHTFTADGTLTVNSSVNVDFLIVGGGGGGAGRVGGGGGGGGVIVGTNQSLSAQTYSVVVGSGGNGGTRGGYGNSITEGETGGESSFNSFIAMGGGGAGGNGAEIIGNDGGSGGGGNYNNGNGGNAKYKNISGTITSMPNTGYATITTNVTAYGNDGGGARQDPNYPPGGGGGAGQVGETPTDNNSSPGSGGNGIQNNFKTGVNIYYGGGGGASGYNGGYGAGGLGGGGSGRDVNNPPLDGENGTSGLGGGGGSGGYYHSGDYFGANGGNGGSGVVIIRFVYSPNTTTTYPGGNDGTDGGSSSQDTYSSITNVTGYGNSGGGFTGIPASEGDDAGGGGGGAGGAGNSRSPNGGGTGNGGIGIQNDFRTNSMVYYAGGGGGGSGTSSTPGTGGSNIGGSGSNNSSAPSSAVANSGSGGGGGNSGVNGGNGADGIVVVRLIDTPPAQQCDWNVGEVISYNRILDISDENKVFDYLKHRYLGTGQSTTGEVYQLSGDLSGSATIRGFPPEFPDTNNILGWYIPETYDASGFWRDVSPFQNDLSSVGTSPKYVKNDKTYKTLSYLKGVKPDSDNDIVASGYKFPEQFLPSDGSYTLIHVSRRISNTGRIFDSASNKNFYSGFVGNKSGVALHSIDVSSSL